MIRKLKWKFILINMIIISVILMISMGILYCSTSNDLKQRSISMMESIMVNPFQLKVIEGHSDEIRLPYFAVLLDEQGTISDVIGDYYDLSDTEYLENMVAQITGSGKTVGELYDTSFRYLYRENSQYNRIVFADISSEKAVLKSLVNTCIWIYLLSFSAFFGICVFFARWAVRPVEIAWEQQKQFVADASHELKTPLTVITTNAELLETSKYGENDIQICSNNILNMARQMRVLLERMIELARGDMQTGTQFRKIDLSKLVLDGILPYEAVFFENDLKLQYVIDEGITVNGDPVQLRQVLDILLDNALKYSDVPGRAEVSLKKQKGKYGILTVSNTGEKIPLEQSALIFQRFYRADNAHSEKGSFGLGLAIAKNIVTGHKGKIWVESNQGLNSFLVRLPLA